jgi:hypothetical protein
MMSNAIKFKTALTKADFIKASKGYLLSQTNNQIFGVFLVLLILGGILGLIINGFQPSILAFVLLASVGLVYSYFIRPVMAASTITQNANWNSEYDWSVSQEGIVINSRSAEAKTGWGLFQNFIETREYFLLVHSDNKRSFQIIPKRVFKSADEEAQFKQLLKARFERQRKLIFSRNGLFVLFLVALVAINVFAMYILGKNR